MNSRERVPFESRTYKQNEITLFSYDPLYLKGRYHKTTPKIRSKTSVFLFSLYQPRDWGFLSVGSTLFSYMCYHWVSSSVQPLFPRISVLWSSNEDVVRFTLLLLPCPVSCSRHHWLCVSFPGSLLCRLNPRVPFISIPLSVLRAFLVPRFFYRT